MFEKIKRAIRKRNNTKKKQEIERALPMFMSHWQWKFGNGPVTGMGEVTYKDWRWFKKLIDEGVIYDLEVVSFKRLHGHIVYKHLKYKIADQEKLVEAFTEHGWRHTEDKKEN